MRNSSFLSPIPNFRITPERPLHRARTPVPSTDCRGPRPALTRSCRTRRCECWYSRSRQIDGIGQVEDFPPHLQARSALQLELFHEIEIELVEGRSARGVASARTELARRRGRECLGGVVIADRDVFRSGNR